MARIDTRSVRAGLLLAVVALAVLAPSASAAVSAPGAVWYRFLDGPLHDFDQAHQVAFSPDGKTTYVTGRVGVKLDPDHFAGAVSDWETAAYQTSSGQLLWAKRLDGPGHSDDEALDVATSADGARVFVTGEVYAKTLGPQQFETVAYEAATGARLWARLYTGLAGSTSYLPSLAASPTQNRVFVVGTSDGQTAGKKVWVVIAYDGATGAELWVRRSVQGQQRFVTGSHPVAVNPNGRTVYVEGTIDDKANPFLTAWEVVAYRTSDGSVRWKTDFDSADADAPVGITVSASGARVYAGGVRASGSQAFPTEQAIETISYDAATGAIVWAHRFHHASGAGSFDEAGGIATAHGRVVVIGDVYDESGAGAEALQTIAYDSTGARLWVRHHDPDPSLYDFGTSVAAAPNGLRFYVTGFVGVGESRYIDTIAYGAIRGTTRWVHRFGSRGSGLDFNLAEDIGVAPASGRVVVTGYADTPSGSLGPSLQDWVTVAYAG
jgi:hypothetical protein